MIFIILIWLISGFVSWFRLVYKDEIWTEAHITALILFLISGIIPLVIEIVEYNFELKILLKNPFYRKKK